MSGIYGNRGLTVLSGSGATIRDEQGKEYLDFYCGSGAALFGHCHPVLVEALSRAAHSPWTVGPGMGSPAREAFRQRISAELPGHAVFFCNSGTESVEAALKLAVCLRPGRNKILALRRGFHGRTMGALSLTFNPQYRKSWSAMLAPVTHVKPEELPGAVDSETAAVFVEPIQGEGGVHPLSYELGAAVTEACRSTGALLVCDEIQSGWGRCSSFIASSGAGLEPDILCFAKGVAGGLPAGLTLWKRELGDFPPSGHGSTYGGSPLVTAMGDASLKLLKDMNYPAKAEAMGAYFRELLSGIDSPLIAEVRGRGLLIGVEIRGKSVPLVKRMQEKGLLALPAGPTVVRFLAPFVAEKNDFDRAAALFAETLEESAE
ncbi:MAG: aspartate aminotransferase family protein [Synergistaceae bacterium]|nr:aspartate aminotransferase family protein [Synergistaceae bacterium]